MITSFRVQIRASREESDLPHPFTQGELGARFLDSKERKLAILRERMQQLHSHILYSHRALSSILSRENYSSSGGSSLRPTTMRQKKCLGMLWPEPLKGALSERFVLIDGPPMGGMAAVKAGVKLWMPGGDFGRIQPTAFSRSGRFILWSQAKQNPGSLSDNTRVERKRTLFPKQSSAFNTQISSSWPRIGAEPSRRRRIPSPPSFSQDWAVHRSQSPSLVEQYREHSVLLWGAYLLLRSRHQRISPQTHVSAAPCCYSELE